MIDMIYLALSDETKTPEVIEKKNVAIEQSGMIHSKVAGRFEIVKELPKKADIWLWTGFTKKEIDEKFGRAG